MPLYTEMYRSGHNGADSKSVVRLIPYRGFESHRLRQITKSSSSDELFIYKYNRWDLNKEGAKRKKTVRWTVFADGGNERSEAIEAAASEKSHRLRQK